MTEALIQEKEVTEWQPLEDQTICTRCVMDTSDPDITFDDEGVCNHCQSFEMKSHALSHLTKKDLDVVLDTIKKHGKNKPFDVVMGISGGVDSSYLLAKLVLKYKLRPLVLHLDNGYDTPEALNNMAELAQKLNISLYLVHINEEEYSDLQLAFLKASTADTEIPTDHAIKATLLDIAAKNNIKYIISGYNIQTEAIMPTAWSHGHSDWKYIKSIYRQFGSKKKLEFFSHYSFWKYIYYTYLKRIQVVELINYQNYSETIAVEYLNILINWQNYEIKHGESIFTRFFQCYILPRKFGYDKRRAHYSNLINAGVMYREYALSKLAQDPYPTQEMFEHDYHFVLDKLHLSPEAFEELMNLPPKSIFDYPSYQSTLWYKFVRWIYRKLRTKKDLRIT